MKKLVSLLLVAIMALAVMAPAMADGEEIKISCYHYMVEGQKADAMEAIQQRFAAAHPEVKIVFDNHAYSQGGSPNYFDQLQTAISAGEYPELMMGNPGSYTDLIENEFVRDLTGNETIKALGLTSCDMGDVSYKGKWYAYPIDFKSWGVFYNVDMFDKLGLKVPTTKTELLNICETLQANGIAPWAQWYKDGASVDIEVRIILWTKAKQDGKLDMFKKLMSGEAKIADYPYFKEAIEVWGERIGAGKGWALPEATANGQTEGNETFITGKAGMLYQGTWNIGTIEAMIEGNDNFHYGFFLCPTDDSGETPCLNTQVDQAFMINDKAANADWAQKFMEYWLSEEMGFWSDAAFQPCITGATTENTPALLKALLDAKAAGNTAGYGDFEVPFSTAFIGAYRKALTAYATWACTGVETSGVKDADTCIAYMQELFDEEIAQAAL